MSLRDLGFSRSVLAGSVLACGALPATLALLLGASSGVVWTVGLGGALCGLSWNMLLGARVRSLLAEPVDHLMAAIEELRSTGHAPRIDEDGAPLLQPILRRFNLAGMALEQREKASHANLLSVEAAFDRVHAVLQSLREGVVVVDPEGRLVMANRSARGLLMGDGRFEGTLLVNLVGEGLRRALRTGLEQVDGVHVGEHRVSDVEHQGRVYDLTVVQVQTNRPDQDYGKVIVIVDVTRNHEVNRLKDELLSSISHELRTPLTNMCSSSEILTTLTPDDETEWREFADMLHSESHRLKTLIDDVMEYSQIETRDTWLLEAAAVGDLAGQAVEAVRADAEHKGLDLRLQLGAAAHVMAEPHRLTEVVGRLLENAVKFTPAGGTVQVTVDRRGGEVEVAVDDSGPGVAVADRQRVFERFTQVGDVMTGKPQGTGLGLSIAQRIIEALGGRIWCEASDLGGARFAFALPAVPAPAPR